MPTPTPYQESSAQLLPAPSPTHPVAGRSVETESPTFDWTPVPAADAYRVQIAETEAFDSIHYDELTKRGTPLSLDALLPATAATVCWRVRAERDDKAASTWSNPAHVARATVEQNVNEAALRVDAPPVPLHPDDRRDTPIDRSAAPFSWEAIPAASGYQLQVAPSEVFDEPAVDLTFDQTTSVTLCELLPEQPSSLYWRVRPLFRVASPGPWSTPVSFSLSSPEDRADAFAQPGESDEGTPRASGPVQQSHTSRTLSLFVSLIAVLSFLVTIVLIALLS